MGGQSLRKSEKVAFLEKFLLWPCSFTIDLESKIFYNFEIWDKLTDVLYFRYIPWKDVHIFLQPVGRWSVIGFLITYNKLIDVIILTTSLVEVIELVQLVWISVQVFGSVLLKSQPRS